MIQSFLRRQRLKSLPAREDGATVVIYALALIPILMLLGFALDNARMNGAKRHMQASIDAAVLAGAREYLLSGTLDETAQKAATSAVVDRIYKADIKFANTALGTATVNVTTTAFGEVTGQAQAPMPLIFGGFFGRKDVLITVDSTAQAGDSRKVEIVLALDNTTSMFESGRFEKLRTASRDFVNIIFDETPVEGLASVSVIPWASVVNINSEKPKGWNAAPVASTALPAVGSQNVPNAAFENRLKYLYAPEAETPYKAAQMAKDFAPVAWRGCVRAAPNERRVNGSYKVTTPLSDGLPSKGMRWHASWLEPELHDTKITPKPKPKPKPPTQPKPKPKPKPKPPTQPKPKPKPKPKPPGPQGSLDPWMAIGRGQDVVRQVAVDVPSDRALWCGFSSKQYGYEGLRNVYLPETSPCTTKSHTKPTKTIKACVSDPTEFDYFKSGGKACTWQKDIFPWDKWQPVSGPNMNCPTAMLGLSGDRTQVLSKLDHMYPVQGGTQADIGLMWGLRALSPRKEWVDFFGHTGKQAPRAFKGTDVRKVMVLLTDGRNEMPYHYEGYYGCTETDWRGRAGKCWTAKGVSKLNRKSLDALTLDSCKAIRETYGVEIYTIAVDVSDKDATKLLADCAADKDRAFNISSAELDETFRSIAARELRLTE
ncbi:MAG: TadE/TadG family type IV pilus assembly protein [Pseudomonadota bacterium]